jgi:hypothetical protein
MIRWAGRMTKPVGSKRGIKHTLKVKFGLPMIDGVTAAAKLFRAMISTSKISASAFSSLNNHTGSLAIYQPKEDK